MTATGCEFILEQGELRAAHLRQPFAGSSSLCFCKKCRKRRIVDEDAHDWQQVQSVRLSTTVQLVRETKPARASQLPSGEIFVPSIHWYSTHDVKF